MPTIWLDSPGLIARNDSLPINSSVDQVNPEETAGTLFKTMPTEKELLEREIAKLSGKSRSPFPPIFGPRLKKVLVG